MSSTYPRPGAIVTTRTAPPPRTIPTDTGVWFVVGTTDKGPLRPVKIGSLQDFINNFGTRQTYSLLYDSLETYFREGGNSAYVSRVVGPAAVIASVNIADAGAVTSLVVRAKGPGAYANTLRVTVAAVTGGYTLTISDTALGVLEVSPTLADQNAAVAWSQNSQWVDISLGASANIPAAIANAPLAGGTDDRLAITDAQWATALGRFTRDLGPGQVSAPGRTSATGKQQIRDHAAAVGHRVALADLIDSATAATVMAAVTTDLRGTNDRFVAAFAPWVVVPGVVPGTTRIVPPSALVAAKIAASDGRGNSPNKPAAGAPLGIASWAIGLSQNPFDDGTGVDVTRDTMYAAGVNQIAFRYGTLEVFGWRSAVDPLGSMQDWVNFGNSRLNAAITARALAIIENYILDEIDGNGRLFGRLQGDLTAMLSEYYRLGSLYGATPEQAFTVDVGPSVNTLATIQNRELHALIGVRMSQDAELVFVEISKVPVSQALVAA